MHDRPFIPILVSAVAFLASACGPANDASQEVISAVDSAGVRIVTSSTPTGSAASWTIAPEPRLVIGGANDQDELLHRVYSTAMLDDGRILVSNSGTSELRIYSTDGTRELSFGGPGEGPGEFAEFASMRILRVTRDSVYVGDAGNVRVNTFDLDGNVGPTISPAFIEGYARPNLSGSFADGHWFAFLPVGSGALRGEIGDILEMQFAFLVFEPSAESATPIAEVPGRKRIVNDGGSYIHYPYIPLTVGPSYAIDQSSVVFNEEGAPEIRRISQTGELEAIYRWSPPQTRVSDIRARFNRAYLADVDDEDKPAYENLLSTPGLPTPSLVPVVESVLADEEGYIWVGRYQLPWDTGQQWDVLSPSGAWTASVTTPEGLTIHEIGADYLLGVHRDSVGVESVMTYDLAR